MNKKEKAISRIATFLFDRIDYAVLYASSKGCSQDEAMKESNTTYEEIKKLLETELKSLPC